MSLKEDWKNTGKGLGQAFKQFGKTFVKSAKHVADKADEKINSEEDEKNLNNEENIEIVEEEKNEAINEENSTSQEKESTVFNDGSWRETGKGLGQAFKNLGKSIGSTVAHPFVSDKEEKNKETEEEK